MNGFVSNFGAPKCPKSNKFSLRIMFPSHFATCHTNSGIPF